jgi:O-antigen biosynthesis protein
MIERFKKSQPESLFKIYARTAYRIFYWKFYWKIRCGIYNVYYLIYRFFGEIVNPEVPFSKDFQYYKWLIKNHNREADLKKIAETVNVLSYKPLISIIVPVYNTPENFLREMLESVLAQVYPHWELCICDDASPLAYVQEILSEYTNKDSRIKVVRHETNKHISYTSNSAIEIASGEFISLLDHDDLITPDALYEVVSLLNQHPDADMIYTDEDKILPDGSLKDAFFKQDWCPDSFLARMYICHLGTYRTSIVREIDGFRPGYEGSQDYDLVLRFTEKTDKIFHISKILYHWRIHPESTAGGMGAKPYATNAAKLALHDAISRRGELGSVTSIPSLPGHYSIRYHITQYKLVSIIISGFNSSEDLNRCLNSIFTKSVYPNFEVLISDNGTKNQDVIKAVNHWLQKEPIRCKLFSLGTPLNYSELNNYLVSKANGDYILFLSSTLEVITPDWIEALVEQVQRASIGAAGVMILNSDDTINHAGIIIGHEGLVGYGHQGLPSTDIGYFACVGVINNYSAVSINCLMCKRDVLDSIGGLNEEICEELSGVDICLKMLDWGYKNIYLPHATLCDWRPQGNYNITTPIVERLPQEVNYFQERWQTLIEQDPCHNPHLTLKNGCYVIKESSML